MPFKEISVALKLNTTGVKSGLQSAASDVKSFGKDVKESSATASTSWATVGQSAKKLGEEMKFVSAGLALIGVAAIKMRGDFEGTFSRMEGLAGVAHSEVAGLQDAVLNLAGETAQAPNALAEALYFVRSAGIDGAAAMDVLEISAKGAAAGLGDSATIADVVTSALGAYGEANLTAAQAGDVLVAAARAGKVEASAMAPTLGRLLPVASQLGVTFDQVAAGVAFLSRTNGDASQSATMLEGVLRKILNPSKQAAEMLANVGLSADQLRQVVAEQGLPAGLQLVSDRLGGNASAMAKVFDDSEALNGALQLTGSHAAAVAQVFGDVAGGTGSLGEAFSAVADDDSFKMRQAMVEIQTGLVKLGGSLAPIAADIVSVGGALVEVFDKLPGPIKGAVLGFGGLLAVVGPVGIAIDKTTKIAKAAGDVLTGLGTKAGLSARAMSGIGQGFGAVGILAATAATSVAIWNARMDRGSALAADFGRKVDDAFAGVTSLDELNEKLHATDDVIADLSKSKAGSNAPWDADWRRDVGKSIEVAGQLRSKWAELGHEAFALSVSTGISFDAALRQVSGQEQAKTAAADAGEAFDAESAAADALTKAVDDLIKSINDYYDATTSVLSAQIDFEAGLDDLTQKLTDNGLAIDASTQAFDINTAAGRDNYDALIAVRDAAIQAGEKVLEQGGSAEDAAAMVQTYIDRLSETLTQAGLTDAEVNTLLTTMGLTPDVITTQFTSNVEDVTAAAALYNETLDSLNNRVVTIFYQQIGITPSAPPPDLGQTIFPHAAGGPTIPGTWNLMGERGPELMFTPRASHVLSHRDTMAAAVQAMALPPGGRAGIGWTGETVDGREAFIPRPNRRIRNRVAAHARPPARPRIDLLRHDGRDVRRRARRVLHEAAVSPAPADRGGMHRGR